MSDIKSDIVWCISQRSGVRIVEPNENLSKAYLEKANEDLLATRVNMDADLKTWSVDAAYYARYNAIYSLLQRCGIKSEIHKCTIDLMEFLKLLTLDLLTEIRTAKKQRIDLRYYTNRTLTEKEIKDNVDSAPRFVMEVEQIVSKLTSDDIDAIRKVLKPLVK